MLFAGLTWVDGAFLILALLYAWQGYERGMVVALGEMVGWFIAWTLAFLLDKHLTFILVTYLGVRNTTAQAVSVLLIVLVANLIIYRAVVEFSFLVPRHYLKGHWQVILGWVPSFVSGLMMVMYLSLIATSVPFVYPYKNKIETSKSHQIFRGWYEQLRGGVETIRSR